MWRDVLIVVGVVAVGAGVCYLLLNDGFTPMPNPATVPPQVSVGGRDHSPDESAAGGESAGLDRPARPPEVLVFVDRAAYADWLMRSAGTGLDARRPESVDFSNNQVVAISWGDKPSAGYELAVQSVTTDDADTIVTLRTSVAPDGGPAARSNPGLTVAVPRSRRVRILVIGDRLPATGGPFADFKDKHDLDYDVTVVPK
jgi:hypothetical protein